MYNWDMENRYNYTVHWQTDPNRDDCSAGRGDFVRESDARNYARMIERDVPGAKVTVNRSTGPMTERQRELARHALGFPNKKNKSNRNHFCIGKGGDGYDDWMDLVSKGLAIRSTGPHWGGDDMFHLTLKGGLEARGPKEHLSAEDAEQMRRIFLEAPATNPPASPDAA